MYVKGLSVSNAEIIAMEKTPRTTSMAFLLNKRYIWSTNILFYIHHSIINSSTLKSIFSLPLYITGSTVPELEQAQVNIISNNICNAPAGYNGAVLSGMLCAGVPQGGVDACQVSQDNLIHVIGQVYKHFLASCHDGHRSSNSVSCSVVCSSL